MRVVENVAYMSTYLEEEFGLSPIVRLNSPHPILEHVKNNMSGRVDCGIDWLLIVYLSEVQEYGFDWGER